jgi:hypothetical protein
MWTIAIKELRELLFSAKFLVLAVAGLVLIALSILSGYAAYTSELKSATTGRQIAVDKLSSA